MNNEQKFSGLAEYYTSGRPAYAGAFIESLYLQHEFSKQILVQNEIKQ